MTYHSTDAKRFHQRRLLHRQTSTAAKLFVAAVPQTFVTLSSCFTDIAPDYWTLDWQSYSQQERAEEGAKFGIPSSVIPQLVEWVTTHVQFPFGLSELRDAVEFYERFQYAESAMVVGIGLHATLVESFNGQLEKEANRGAGLLERIERGDVLAGGGTTLGFEPLGFDAMSFHSWLCNYSPEEIETELGIRINENGLLSSLADGIRTADFVREFGEQAIWEQWQIVSYSTTA